jgi:hypothetical protein
MKTKDVLPLLLAGQALVILVMLVVLVVLISFRRRL